MKNLLLILVLILSFNICYVQNCPLIVIEDVEGMPGDTVEVTMYLSNIEGFLAFQGTINHDISVLNFVGAEPGDLFDEDFRVETNEPFVGTGQVLIVGMNNASLDTYDFSATPTEFINLYFVIVGQVGEQSPIIFDDSVLGIEFVSLTNTGSASVQLCGNIAGSVSISDNPTTPSDFDVSVAITNVSCMQTNLGSIAATGVFGTPPYTFTWTGPNNFNVVDQSIVNELLPGFYNLTATDADGTQVVINGIEVKEQSGGFEITTTIQNNFCDDDSSGRITTNTTSNTTGGPLTFDWNTGATSESIFNLANGFYSLTITDNLGCTQTHEFEIDGSRGFLVNFEVGASCNGESTGHIYPDDGGEDYNYFWSNSAITDSISNIASGTYDVSIEDANGCLQVTTVDVPEFEENSSLQLDIQCASLGMNNGSVFPSFTGDLEGEPLSVSQFQNSQGEDLTIIDLSPGDYFITVTSVNGCAYTDEATIEESLSDIRTDYYSCLLDSIQFETSSNNPNLQYTWFPDSTYVDRTAADPIFLTHNFPLPNFNTVLIVTGAEGCTNTIGVTINETDACVWPGDTNNDNTVNAQDLLHVGLANGSSGPARPEPNATEWFTQPSILWNDNIGNSGLDKMFADCNGDGLVNDDDISAIVQNNGLSHLSFTEESHPNRNMGAPLFVDLPDEIIENSATDIGITLGDVNEQLSGAYGIAFQILYDPAVTTIEPNSFNEKGWLSGDSQNIWDINFQDIEEGVLDVALTRTNGEGIDGFGTIALINCTFSASVQSEIEIEIANAIVLNADAEELLVQPVPTTSIIQTSSTQSINATQFNESIFPNPSSDLLRIQSDRDIDSYTIFNAMGQSSLQGSLSQNQINIEKLNAGVYFIQLSGEKGVTTHKLVVE